jgi:hypothetical protein
VRRPYPARAQRVRTRGGKFGRMSRTIHEIGAAIRRASVYPPIRNLAAAAATRAKPKDFLGQAREVYKEFHRRWRYVMDPASRELVTASPEAIYKLMLAGDGIGVGEGRGAGDCDCATVALGSMLEAIGFNTRIATTADAWARPGRMFGHVFIQARVPNFGWVTVDPVLYAWNKTGGSNKRFGEIAKHSRLGIWNLDGRLLATQGNFGNTNTGEPANEGAMFGEMPSVEAWPDVVGLAGALDDDTMPDDWSTVGPMGFGAAVGALGMIDGAALAGIGVEVDTEDWGGIQGARTPMLELSPDDYMYMSFVGTPYNGMMAFGDDGDIYTYDGTLGRGFFRRLFRRVRKGIKKVRSKIRKGIRKVLKKTKFGRVLLKIGGKIKRIAMKIVRPLVKFVGKWASKLAPIAAMIPGYGTAIAAGLAAAGKVAKLMQKFGVTTKGAKGKVRGLKLKNPKNLPAFQRALKQEAAVMKAKAKRNPAAFKRMLAAQKQRLAA